jgi:hypothetical protein
VLGVYFVYERKLKDVYKEGKRIKKNKDTKKGNSKDEKERKRNRNIKKKRGKTWFL